MSQALARGRKEGLIGRPETRSFRRSYLRSAVSTLTSLPALAYLGLFVGALIGGIVFNALVLQRARHPMPLFSGAHAAPGVKPTDGKITRYQTVEGPHAISRTLEAKAQPTIHSPSASSALSMSSSAESDGMSTVHPNLDDPIGELLRREKADEAAQLLKTAREALVKLGYPLASTSSERAIRDAIYEFERNHGRPEGALTPGIAKLLRAAARSANH